MHITIFVYGSWGDIRPHVVLGKALQAAGHEVQVVASTSYEKWVRERGLGFHPLPMDVNTFAKENAAIMDESFVRQFQIMRKEMPAIFTQMGLECLEATRESDVLITVEFGIPLLIDALKVNNLKPILLNPAALNPTSEFAFLGFPQAPGWFPFPAWYNRLTYSILRRIQWSIVGKARNELRKKHLSDMPKSKLKDYKALLDIAPAATIVSKHVFQRPADWPEHYQVTGYLYDDDTDWTPPQDLIDFLVAGEAPVYIGCGTRLSYTNPKALDSLPNPGLSFCGYMRPIALLQIYPLYKKIVSL